MRRIWYAALGLALFALLGNPTASFALSWPLQREGDSGPNVFTIQHLLNAHGQTLTADGAFGPTTTTKVRSFQSSKGLAADGIVGPATWEALIITVRSGSSGEAAKAAQRQLNKYGYGLVVDGAFGAASDSATRDFQSKHGLSADGIIGPATWSALTSGSSGGGSTRAQLATTIRNSSRIALATVHSSGVVDSATARQNIIDTSNGGAARRSSYGEAPGGTVLLDTRLLNGMISLSNTWTYSVSEIAGGSHSSNSRHYAGVAVDVNVINGSHVSSSHPSQSAFRSRCVALGATEVLGPGDAGHSTHIHCAWPRP